MKKRLIEIYLYLCKLFRKVKKPEKILDKMNLSMFDFCNQLNSMEYKYDKLHGLLDNVADPDTFFDEKDYLPAQKIIFEGKEFLAPNNPERILRLNYGNIEQFPENLDLHRHLDKQQNSAELLKQVEKKQ